MQSHSFSLTSPSLPSPPTKAMSEKKEENNFKITLTHIEAFNFCFKELIRLNNQRHKRHQPAFAIMQQIVEEEKIDSLESILLIDKFIMHILYYNLIDYLGYFYNKLHFFKDYLLILDLDNRIANYGLPYNNILSILVSRDSVDILSFLKSKGWTFSTRDMQVAIVNHAEKSVKFLLENIFLSQDDKDRLAQTALEEGNISIFNQLIPGDELGFFNGQIKELKQSPNCIMGRDVFNQISKYFRFSAFEDVEKACTKLSEYLDENFNESKYIIPLKKIKLACHLAQTAFPRWASQLALYRRQFDFSLLLKRYGAKKDIVHEMEIGINYYKFVNQFKDKKPTFEELISQVSTVRCKDEIKRGNKDDYLFKQRDNNWQGSWTPCFGTYDFLYPVVAREMLLAEYPTKKGYETRYKGRLLSKTEIIAPSDDIFCFKWHHGLASISDLSPDINELLSQLYAVELRQILDNPQKFYSLLAKTLWLIGNLTPLRRGTGRIVESILSLAHIKNNLVPPVLQVSYQLDCFNITFNSFERYSAVFPYLFMQPTLHPIIQDAIYIEYKQSPALQALLKHYNLNPPSLRHEYKCSAKGSAYASSNENELWKILLEELGDSKKLTDKEELFDAAFITHNKLVEQPSVSHEIFKNYIRNYPVFLKKMDLIPFLNYAICDRNLDMALEILALGIVDLNSKLSRDDPTTPLMRAIESNNLAMIKLIAETKTPFGSMDLHKPNEEGMSPLFFSVGKRCNVATKYLLSKLDLEQFDLEQLYKGYTVLSLAISLEDDIACRMLLEAKANPNTPSLTPHVLTKRPTLISPLESAAATSNYTLVKLLLERKAKPLDQGGLPFNYLSVFLEARARHDEGKDILIWLEFRAVRTCINDLVAQTTLYPELMGLIPAIYDYYLFLINGMPLLFVENTLRKLLNLIETRQIYKFTHLLFKPNKLHIKLENSSCSTFLYPSGDKNRLVSVSGERDEKEETQMKRMHLTG